MDQQIPFECHMLIFLNVLSALEKASIHWSFCRVLVNYGELLLNTKELSTPNGNQTHSTEVGIDWALEGIIKLLSKVIYHKMRSLRNQ